MLNDRLDKLNTLAKLSVKGERHPIYTDTGITGSRPVSNEPSQSQQDTTTTTQQQPKGQGRGRGGGRGGVTAPETEVPRRSRGRPRSQGVFPG